MKVRSSLKLRGKGSFFVKRKGVLFMRNKKNPRLNARQG